MKKRVPLQRFLDNCRNVLVYVDDILVTCPKCGSTARVTPSDPPVERNRLGIFAVVTPRRLTCTRCTWRAVWNNGTVARRFLGPVDLARRARDTINVYRFAGGHMRDPYFGLPLTLQTATRHGVLFAYNAGHLDWIEGYVAAGLRERRNDVGSANRAIGSRLPRWVKVAKNREDVIRALSRLRHRLAETSPRSGMRPA